MKKLFYILLLVLFLFSAQYSFCDHVITEQDLTQLYGHIIQLKQELELLQNTFTAQSKSLESLRQLIIIYEQKINSLQAQLTAYEQQTESLKNLQTSLSTELQQAQEQLSESEESLRELKKLLKEYQGSTIRTAIIVGVASYFLGFITVKILDNN